MPTVHKPVLFKEVLEYLNPTVNQNFIDATFGGGGHGLAILEKIKPRGKLLAIDANGDVAELITNKKNIIFVNENFVNVDKIVKNFFPHQVNGVLLDLGLSSDELEQSGRGFSFLKDEPLDMRFDVRQSLTAKEIVNCYSLEKIIDIFKKFGEEPASRKIAELIVKQRKNHKITTTRELVSLILMAKNNHKKRIHPATKIFQALRIAVNDELRSLTFFLPRAWEVLVPGARLAVISFHGLEDRIVKNYFRFLISQDKPLIKILTKKPIVASEKEINDNPRARSAKLRVIEKI